jgi:hypothetical protein
MAEPQEPFEPNPMPEEEPAPRVIPITEEPDDGEEDESEDEAQEDSDEEALDVVWYAV